VIGVDGVVEATLSVGGEPIGVATGPQGAPNAGTMYVTNFLDNSLSVLLPDGSVGAALEVTTATGLSGVGVASSAAPVPGMIAVSNYTEGSVTALRPDGTILYSVQVAPNPSRVALVR
jgi:hypothetical protein